jgi:hypothetical protein
MDNKELKEVSWYHSLVNAWFVSAVASDCLMAIFFLVCLVIHLYFNNTFYLSLYGVAFSILGIACIIRIFAENKKYIESLINNKEPKSLKAFDFINRILFVANSACLLYSVLVINGRINL